MDHIKLVHRLYIFSILISSLTFPTTVLLLTPKQPGRPSSLQARLNLTSPTSAFQTPSINRSLRPAPPDFAPDGVCIGLYLDEHHRHWPWPAERWRWVDDAMAAVAPERWHATREQAAAALAGAARVRTVDDPHLTRWLKTIARLDAAPTLFPLVERRCSSFSQWWTRATRGLNRAGELL